jgi:hypothetical protein
MRLSKECFYSFRIDCQISPLKGRSGKEVIPQSEVVCTTYLYRWEADLADVVVACKSKDAFDLQSTWTSSAGFSLSSTYLKNIGNFKYSLKS